jgi:hypothetical protein
LLSGLDWVRTPGLLQTYHACCWAAALAVRSCCCGVLCRVCCVRLIHSPDDTAC